MITLKAKKAKSWREKITGLIAIDKPYPLLINTRFGIHTFGLKFPIDVLILDSSDRVVILKSGLKPNSFFFWNPRFDQVLELPVGMIGKERIKKGEKLQITFE